MGVERSTFVIDADGNVATVMRRVKPDTHTEQVLEALPGRPGAVAPIVAGRRHHDALRKGDPAGEATMTPSARMWRNW